MTDSAEIDNKKLSSAHMELDDVRGESELDVSSDDSRRHAAPRIRHVTFVLLDHCTSSLLSLSLSLCLCV